VDLALAAITCDPYLAADIDALALLNHNAIQAERQFHRIKIRRTSRSDA